MDRNHVGEWMSSWAQDMRFAYRQFRRTPGFAAATVLTLALGIGATTSIFSVVNGVLLRPLPYPAPDRIVQLWQLDQGGKQMQFSDPNFDDLEAASRSFAALATFAGGAPISASGDIAPTRGSMSDVSRHFFDVLGVQPAIGRTFVAEEERQGGPAAAVVSWGFWQRVFGGGPDVIGKRLVIGDRTYTVVGVMRPELDLPAGTDIWVSREIFGRDLLGEHPNRTAHNWEVVGRLRPGVTLPQARREVSTLAASLAARYGTQTMMANAAVVPLREQLVGSSRPTLLVLLAASAVLLVIACANAANMLMARLTARRTELALRLALGAGRSRLLQQCLAESATVALAGGTVGVLLAIAGTRALLALDPGQLPRTGAVRVDPQVLLFALGVSLATATALALVTAWRTARGDLREMLSAAERTMSGAGSTARARRSIVVAQIAMTLVLLIAAGLLGHSFVRLLSVDPGFRTDRVVVLDLSIDAADSTAILQRAGFYHELMRRLGAMPGVTTVGGINEIPLATLGTTSGTFLETSPGEHISIADFQTLFQDHTRTGEAEFRTASGGYFAVMHIPVLEGRTFDERDVPTAPHVAVISASLAKARWPGQSAIGKMIQFGNMDGDLHPFTIVGVVGDVREAALGIPPKPMFYADYLQRPNTTTRMNVVMAGPASSAAISAGARTILSALRPDVPPRFRTIEAIVDSSVAGQRLVLLLVGVFGGAALLLAALGLYSVISYLVAQRAHELSIRVALGAQQDDVVLLVLRQGAVLVGAGIAVGTLTAFAATRLLSGLLYGVGARDPLAFGGVALVVAGVALAACWVPARRAARVEVMDVLRG